MSTVELRERVHQAIDELQEEQLKAVHDLLEAFLPSSQTTDDDLTLQDKRRVLAETVQWMTAHPLSASAPRLTRDDLHERR